MSALGWDIRIALLLGLTARLFLILYGEWQDSVMEVKYTDVDYYVFTDAARFMYQGMSPYSRATYRYTPLLAWILQPNITWSPLFGKLLFVLFDVFSGYLIYLLLKSEAAGATRSVQCAYFWLLNPLPMTVSSRGNAESIMSFLVLFSLRLFQKQNVIFGAFIFTLSVHVKIYPLTYALPLYLFVNSQGNCYRKPYDGVLDWLSKTFHPTRAAAALVLVSAISFIVITGICYYLYGWDFLHETYLYHVTRRDIKHNFSVYFYMIYLTGSTWYSGILGLLSFLPQLALLVVSSLKFYRDPPTCFFLNTFIFVTFNKVCTSQYYLWYLCLLPLILPSLTMSVKKAFLILGLWLGGQGVWLFPAYLLEFEGFNTFLYIWMAGILFFLINITVIIAILDSYVDSSWGIQKSKC